MAKNKKLPEILHKTFLADYSIEELRKKIEEDSRYTVLANDRTLFNPLQEIPSGATEHIGEYYAWLMTQPEYFYFIIKCLFQMESFPAQCLILRELYNHRFPILIASRGFSKTYILGMYALIAMITRPGIRCIITGAGFRQAKLVFDVMEQIWNKSNMLRSCFKERSSGVVHGTDNWSIRLGDSVTSAIPVGPDGSKVRGYRANVLLSDEFATLNRTVFEEVMSGFLSVSSSPMEQINHAAKLSTMKQLNIPISLQDEELDILDNQLILSGTAYYKHNHFYTYYQKWREIIYNHDNPAKLREIVGEDYDEKFFKPKNYCVIRIPIELSTGGFMDMEQISRIKATTTRDTFKREYSACFSDDSDGFFKRSLLDSCMVVDGFVSPEGIPIDVFTAMLYGDPNKKYIYGIDPAYQGDNFAIVILECEENYRKIVHCWTTQSSDHKQRLSDGSITEHDYYHYCVRKIRNLMKRFPCSGIALDTQGGGKAILEAFTDITKLEPGETIVLPQINLSGKPRDTDGMAGDHIILEITNNINWIVEANNAMKLDFEDKKLLFPHHDTLSYTMSEFYDESVGVRSALYDTLEDCTYEIEELKIELTNIVISETASGKQKFDTPDTKTAAHKKGRLKKDRYSALLMANWMGRTMYIEETRGPSPNTFSLQGYDGKYKARFELEPKFVGNQSICNKLNQLYK